MYCHTIYLLTATSFLPTLFFNVPGVGWNWLHLVRRPLIGLLYQTSPDGRWVWNSRWNKNWQGKSKYLEENCSNAALFTTNPTWPDLGLYPDCRDGKPETKRLSYGTAVCPVYFTDSIIKTKVMCTGFQCLQSCSCFSLILSSSSNWEHYFTGTDKMLNKMSSNFCCTCFGNKNWSYQFWETQVCSPQTSGLRTDVLNYHLGCEAI
jgi:hypothetical protein